MTAAVSHPRPVLYLVPGAGRGRIARPPAPPTTMSPPLSSVAAEYAARVLGTLFAPVAAHVARALEQHAPPLTARGRPEAWAAAIAFLLAEESRLFEYDCCSTRTSLARELGSSLPTLRRRAAEIRVALDPLHLELPDPEATEEAECAGGLT